MTSGYIQTLFGHNINDGSDYKVVGHNLGMVRPKAQATYIEQRDADSVDSGGYTVSERQNFIQVQVGYENREALGDQLLVWCKRGTEGPVVSRFPDDGDLYQLGTRSLDVFPDPDFPTIYTVLLSSGETNWRASVADSTSWSASGGASSSHTLSIGGKDETRLSVTITGVTAPAGIWLHQDVCQLINPLTALGLVAVCIEIDTAALVAAGKLRANCWDLRLAVGAVNNAPRWIEDPNTDHTKVWFVVDLRAGFNLTLYPGTAQVETATAVGTITGTGNAQVVVTAAGMSGSPRTLNVAVTSGDTPAVWAAKVRAALDGDAVIAARFDVTGAGTQIILQRSSPADNDSTLNISLANGTCTGIVADAFSDNTTAGSLYTVASSGALDTLEFEHTPTAKATLKGAPFQFTLVHEDEWLTVKKTRTTLTDYKVTVVERGVLGTDEQAHSGGDVFSFIQYPIIMTYGNLAAGNPATGNTAYNNNKPVFDLGDSDNEQGVYNSSSKFYDPTLPNRPGSWSAFLKRDPGSSSNIYRFADAASSGNPALGIKAAAYNKNSSWIADTVTIGWKLSDKRGFKRIVEATGYSYRTDTLWPATTELQASNNGNDWDTVFAEGSPASPDVDDAWSAHTNVDLDDDSCTMLRLVVSGKSDKRPSSFQRFEARTMTIEYTTPVTITRLGEQDNYHVSLKVTNTASYQGQTVADSITVTYPLRAGRSLVIDGEEGEATYDGTNVHGAIDPDDDSRTVYLRGLPGTNTITVESVGMQDIGTATIAVSAYARRP